MPNTLQIDQFAAGTHAWFIRELNPLLSEGAPDVLRELINYGVAPDTFLMTIFQRAIAGECQYRSALTQ